MPAAAHITAAARTLPLNASPWADLQGHTTYASNEIRQIARLPQFADKSTGISPAQPDY